jgi:hypothetical protein
MILFGWRKKGEVAWSGLLKCEACARWRLHYGIRAKRWFTLFFIPVIPLWGDNQLMCAVCVRKQQVSQQEFEALCEAGVRNRELAEQYQDNPQELARRLALANPEPAAGAAPAAEQRLEAAS